MPELNVLAGYICLINVNDSDIKEVGSTLYNGNVINTLFEDDVIMTTEHNVDVFNM